MINQTSQKLKGWYFYQFSYIMMFLFGILGISEQLRNHLILEWSNVGLLMILSILSLIGLFQTIIVPMVKIVDRRVYLYKKPSFLMSYYNFLIDDLEQIELVKGPFRWKISIKLSNAKEMNYSPSPLETDLKRIISFIKQLKRL
jgi:hypothetical protein